MATCTRAPLPPELEKGKDAAILPAAVAPAVLAKPGKERGAFLPELEKGKDAPILAAAIAPAFLAKPGKEMGSCSPQPEKEKPLARPAPNTAAENLINPGKKMRRPVPMTDDERNKINYLKEQHRSGLEELRELFQIQKDLRHYHDELLFRRRCLAARLVSRIVFQCRDAAYVKRHLDMGLKVRDKLPEDLKQARPPITMALIMWHEMGRALHIGMDAFIDEYSNTKEYRRGILALVPGAVCDENGALRDSVASQE